MAVYVELWIFQLVVIKLNYYYNIMDLPSNSRVKVKLELKLRVMATERKSMTYTL